MQLGEIWYSAICVLDLWICLYLCIWGSTAASTPNQGTVGMFTPFSLFFRLWRGWGAVSPSPHGFWVCFVVAAFFPLKDIHKVRDRAYQKYLEFTQNIWLFLGIWERTKLFIIKDSNIFIVPWTHAILSSCVSWEPFCYWGHALNVSYQLFIKELRNTLSDFSFLAKNGNCLTCSGNSFTNYKSIPFFTTVGLILFPQMLPKYVSLFLESPVWKFHICDLNMKHWHHLK